MQVRMKIGPKSGQVVDLVYHAARTLVEAGQAEDVHDQMRLPKAEVTRIDSVSVEGQKLPDEMISATTSTGRNIPVAIETHFKKKRK